MENSQNIMDVNPVRGAGSFALLSGYTVFLACCQIGVISLSLAQLTISTLIAWAVLAGSAAAGLATWSLLRSWRGGDLSEETKVVDTQPRPLSRALQVIVAMAVIAPAAACYVALWGLSLTNPDLSCDGTTYHIPGIHLWMMKGYVHWIDPQFEPAKFMNGYPKGIELMCFLLARTLGPAAVNAGNLAFLPLGVLGIVTLARLLGASRLMAAAAGAALVLVPVHISQSATTYVDSGYASAVIAMVAAVVFSISRLSAHGALPWSALPTLGCTMGLALAGKGTGGLAASIGAAVLMVLVLRAVRSRRRSTPKPRFAPLEGGTQEPGRQDSILLRGIAFLVITGVLAVVVGGYWYIRNWVLTGSPVYPAGVTIAGCQIFPGMPISKMMGFEDCTPEVMRSWTGAAKVLAVWSQQGVEGYGWPATIWFLDSRNGGLGFLWLLACVPAVVVIVISAIRQAGQRTLVLSLLAIVALAFLATPMNWWARYTLWIYALGLPCLAMAASRLLGASGGTKTAGSSPIKSTPPRRVLSVILKCYLAFCVLVLLAEGTITLMMNAAWIRNPQLLANAR